MKRILFGIAGVVAVAALVFALIAPIGPVPGFLIGGDATENPAVWPSTAAVDEIHLKVPGSPPRVVIIWVVEHDDELYVVGAEESGWVAMIGVRSPVQMRLDDRLYDLTAERVTAGWEDVVESYRAKYRPNYPDIVASFPPPEEAAGYVAVFRLDRG